MARLKRFVRWEVKDGGRLPDFVSGYVLLATDLMERGVLHDVGQRLRIRRKGGYPGLDVFLYLLALLGSEFQGGLRPFWDRIRHEARALGALGGRRQLMSPSAVSRALGVVEVDRLRECTSWLLGPATGADDVLRHPSVLWRDAQGEGWHVFDFDPTVTGLRQRALPEGEDLPSPSRRTDGFAEPGYAGRKRCEVQFRRASLQHSGSGLWLDARLEPGNGDRRVELRAAVDVVVATCQRLEHPLARSLFRADGEFGDVPSYTTYRERGVPFVTRLTRPKLFEDPKLLRALTCGEWAYVPDDGSGPARSACEVGMMTIPAGDAVLREDGTRFEPIVVRVVASRFPRSSDPNHGVVLDGWQYELFAVDVDPAAWPAEQAVGMYFGRGGQENRFAQEDHEIGLDRIFSFHLPGQELACIVGLMVWNLRITHGFALDRPPAAVPVQRPWTARYDHRRSSLDVLAETFEAKQVPAAPPEAADAVDALLEALDWDGLLRRRPGWRWRAGEGLTCPNDAPLALATVDFPPTQSPAGRLSFRADAIACDACPLKGTCFRSPTQGQRKMISITIDRTTATPLRHLLNASRTRGVHNRSQNRRARHPHSGIVVLPTPPLGALRLFEPAPALFLPRQARRHYERVAQQLSFSVTVPQPSSAPRQHRLLATSAAQRQHRRRTWTERLKPNALPAGDTISVSAYAPPGLRARIAGHLRLDSRAKL